MKKILVFIFVFIFLFCFNCFKIFGQENTSETKRVLILPFDIYSPPEYSYLKEAIPEMLISRLFSPSKIEIVEMEKVKEEIKNFEKINRKTAEDLGNKFKANYVIWGSITVLGEGVSIDAQIIDLSGEKKPAQFFQEIKNISDIIPQISKFAQKSKDVYRRKGGRFL
uniref:TolB N-terminal domain-containing protein n=1 Tax=Thermodesulfobacterium geofontis TaxID=1295609 RepID=A0A7C4NZL7_9BACT